ncbi:hypothetical protein [Methanobrevibacter arboriphilus]
MEEMGIDKKIIEKVEKVAKKKKQTFQKVIFMILQKLMLEENLLILNLKN